MRGQCNDGAYGIICGQEQALWAGTGVDQSTLLLEMVKWHALLTMVMNVLTLCFR